MANIFDLTNTTDLPQGIRVGLNRQKTPNKFESDICELIKIAGTDLTIDELTVGYYRKFGGKINKKLMMHKLYMAVRNRDCRFEKVSRTKSTYRLKDKKCTV